MPPISASARSSSMGCAVPPIGRPASSRPPTNGISDAWKTVTEVTASTRATLTIPQAERDRLALIYGHFISGHRRGYKLSDGSPAVRFEACPANEPRFFGTRHRRSSHPVQRRVHRRPSRAATTSRSGSAATNRSSVTPSGSDPPAARADMRRRFASAGLPRAPTETGGRGQMASFSVRKPRRATPSARIGTGSRRASGNSPSSALSCDRPRSSLVVSMNALPGHGSCGVPHDPAPRRVRIGLRPRCRGPGAGRPHGPGGAGGAHRPSHWRVQVSVKPSRLGPIVFSHPGSRAGQTDGLPSVDRARPRVSQYRRSASLVCVTREAPNSQARRGRNQLLVADQGCGYARNSPRAPVRAGACYAYLDSLAVKPHASAQALDHVVQGVAGHGPPLVGHLRVPTPGSLSAWETPTRRGRGAVGGGQTRVPDRVQVRVTTRSASSAASGVADAFVRQPHATWSSGSPWRRIICLRRSPSASAEGMAARPEGSAPPSDDMQVSRPRVASAPRGGLASCWKAGVAGCLWRVVQPQIGQRWGGIEIL